MKLYDFNQRKDASSPEGFIEKFLEHVANSPDNVAMEMIPSGQTFTYSQLLEMSERIKSNLVGMGVGSGDRIVVMLPSSAEFIASVLAITSLGSMAIFVGNNVTDFELQPRLDDSKPSGAIVVSDTLSKPLLKCDTLRFALTLAEPSCDNAGRGIKIRGLKGTKLNRITLTPPSGNPGTGCHFTYKGFGYPLGAVHRYNDYSWSLDGYKTTFKDVTNRNHLMALPMYPIYGLVTSLFALTIGAKLIVVTDIKNVDIYNVISQKKVGYLGLVPVMIENLMVEGDYYKKLGKDPKKDFVEGMCLVSGGSFLDKTILQKFENIFGCVPYQGFGSSETLPILASDFKHNLLGSVGIPMNDEFDVSIVDINGNQLEDGAIGQVAINSPTLSKEYINRPFETKSICRGNRMLTGDLGYKNADGYLFFVGRHMRFTKIAAQMTDLVEIENVFNAHPLVERSISTVRRSEKNSEYVYTEISVRPGSNISKTELVEHCRRFIAPHKIPRGINIIERKKRHYLSNPKTAWEGMQ